MDIYLLISSLVLLIIGICITYKYTFSGLEIKKVKFTTEKYDSVPIKISGLLVTPKKNEKEKIPSLVFSHGITAKKEAYVMLIRHLALSGFRVLAIDLRGHGHSKGFCDFGKLEIYDVFSAIDYLVEEEKVDRDKIAVVGHSLGGVTSTRAASLDKNNLIKSTVAIFCWRSIKEAIEKIFGPLEGFVGRMWPFFAFSRSFNILDKKEQEERNVIKLLSRDKPKNYQLIIGSRDELASVKDQKEVMARATDGDEVIEEEIYGNLKDGTARRFSVIQQITHILEARSRKLFNKITEWLQYCFQIEPTPLKKELPLREIGMLIFMAGLFLSSLFIAQIFYNLRPQVYLTPEIIQKLDISQFIFSLLAITVIYFVSSFFSFRVARIIKIKPFIPNWGGDLVSVFFLSRLFLFIPLAVLFIFINKTLISIFNFNPFYSLFLEASLTILPLLWFFLAYNLAAEKLNIFGLMPSSLKAFSLLFFIFLVNIGFEEFLFRETIQKNLYYLGIIKAIIITIIIYTIINSFSLTLGFSYLAPSWKYMINFTYFKIHFLPAVFFMSIFIFLGVGTILAYLFFKTGTIFPGVFFQSFLLSWLFSSLSCRGY